MGNTRDVDVSATQLFDFSCKKSSVLEVCRLASEFRDAIAAERQTAKL